ncbi:MULTISPECIES: RNA chaperone Hfq [Metabacillus]|uniref:RNA chaperone Hfq n=1 Tax=Metabacillus TaxID=2675233 RepID=UPI000C7F87F2|nr:MULTISPECIES: RNA chaperone Hfq [Metabacillus]MCM3443986.1 RNA chaperone Hfq [Metabacillus halosaccharovorans]PMC35037.1 RNA chaperone Hfq [Bacillus sp. UMB0899]
MRNKKVNIQDRFLNEIRKHKVPTTIYLQSGVPIEGIITNYDGFTVTLESKGKQQLIYKHAISTFTPSKRIDINLSI